MKKIIQAFLKILSAAVLKKYKPKVIGITGSVGKTSAKRAVSLVLEDYSPVASPKNYNTEIGVPLTILGAENPGRSFWGWCRVLLSGFKLLLFKSGNYPQVLILEMAADHPGDIGYLTSFTRPQIGVITSVGPTHLEFFGNLETVVKEKSNLVLGLPEDGTAVINIDQAALAELSSHLKSKVITFGLHNADLTADDIKIDRQRGGLEFILIYHEKSTKVKVPDLVGQPAVYTLLAAAGVGVAYGMELEEIAKKLSRYSPPPGRLNLLPGIKYTKIIDDSYNSSPLAVKAALDVLLHLSCQGDKYAVLGDMLELGAYTRQAHQEVGRDVARFGIDYLVTVGERAKDIAVAAREYGMNPDRIFSFDNSVEAGKFLQDRIQEGDLILVKGSAAMAMEKIVKEIMAEPERAEELLVRQP